MVRRSPGDGTLFKRKDGYWVGGIELPPGPDGKRRQKKVVRKSRNECLQAVREIKNDLAVHQLPTRTITVGKWLDYWMEEILPQRKLRPGTLTYYGNAVRLYIKPALGSQRMDKLTPAEIRDMYKNLRVQVSSHAALKAHKTLRAAFKSAVRDGLLTYSVMDRVDKPAHTSEEQESFDAATSMRIIAAAVDSQGEMWGSRWALGFVTGAREAEILGLEWDRVDLERGLLDISWQLQRLKKSHGCGDPTDGRYPCGMKRPSFCPGAHWQLPVGMQWRECEGSLVWTRPKTRAGKRMIPLIPQMADVLSGIRTVNRHNLVFCEADGRPFAPDRDQKRWRELLKTANVPHIRQHSIRHSTATLLLEAGVDAHVVAEILGHTDIAVTRGYQHVDMRLARQAWSNLAVVLPPNKQTE